MRGLNTSLEQDIALALKRHPHMTIGELSNYLSTPVQTLRNYRPDLLDHQPHRMPAQRSTVDNTIKRAFRKVIGHDPFNDFD